MRTSSTSWVILRSRSSTAALSAVFSRTSAAVRSTNRLGSRRCSAVCDSRFEVGFSAAADALITLARKQPQAPQYGCFGAIAGDAGSMAVALDTQAGDRNVAVSPCPKT